MAAADTSQPAKASTNRAILFYRLAKVCATRWLKPTVTPKQRAQGELVHHNYSHQNGRRGNSARATCSLSHLLKPHHVHRVSLTCVASSADVSHSESPPMWPLHSPVGPRRVRLMRGSPLPRAMHLFSRRAPVMGHILYASLLHATKGLSQPPLPAIAHHGIANAPRHRHSKPHR